MELSLMEKFADPNLFQSLTMGERLAGSAVTAIMGMGVTFAILIIIWVMIAIMAKFVKATEKKKEAAPVGASTPSVAPAAAAGGIAAAAAPAAAVADDAALVAVIAAAIAAFEGDGASNLVVKKIVRAGGPVQPWARQGINECFESRKF